MVKTIVTGAGGKMGGRIISLIGMEEGIELAAAVERSDHPAVGRDVGELLGLGAGGIVIENEFSACMAKGDVAIDFTSHAASMQHLQTAVQLKSPSLSAVRDFPQRKWKKYEAWPSACPVFLPPI